MGLRPPGRTDAGHGDQPPVRGSHPRVGPRRVVRASQVERNDTLGGLSALTSKSVQSVQRLLLGYGFLAPLLLALALVLPGIGLPVSGAGDPVVRAVRLGLPAVMVVLLLAGPYNSAWADPGVAAAYWGLVAVAAIRTATTPEADRS